MTTEELKKRVETNRVNQIRGRKARKQQAIMDKARATVTDDQSEIVIEQLVRVLDIQTEMGKEFVRQALVNAALFDRKQRDYGSGNYLAFGQMGAVMRCHDKLMRLKRMVFDNPSATPENETVEDSWDDLANIAVIGRLCSSGRWK
jgi:ABC-type histidine transport system ATPase subunit